MTSSRDIETLERQYHIARSLETWAGEMARSHPGRDLYRLRRVAVDFRFETIQYTVCFLLIEEPEFAARYNPNDPISPNPIREHTISFNLPYSRTTNEILLRECTEIYHQIWENHHARRRIHELEDRFRREQEQAASEHYLYGLRNFIIRETEQIDRVHGSVADNLLNQLQQRRYNQQRTQTINYGYRILQWFVGFDGDPYISNKEAQKKAEQLLLDNLTEKQRKQYEKHKYFDVKGSHGGLYRIKFGRQMNIYLLNKSTLDYCRETGEYICFLPDGNLVEQDCMLAQKIALENDEERTLKIANRFGGLNNYNRYFDNVDDPRIGSTLRIRLPNDFTVRNTREPSND
jgi:hypothetical protein